MTYVGPYTKSYDMTHLYEPCEYTIIAYKDCLLDVISKQFPKFFELIRKANLEAFYNDLSKKHTVFIPFMLNPDQFDTQTAYLLCKSYTVPYSLNLPSLQSSPSLLLESTIPQNNLLIETTAGKTSVNKNCILKPDICACNGIIHVIENINVFPNIII